MKTIFTLNFVNKSIVGTKSAIARANKCLEPEYSELCALLEKHPGFKVEAKRIDQKKDKKTYNGLTFQAMKDFIATQENSKLMLVKFEKVMKVAEAKGAKYPLTKKWFLENYPNYKKNEVADSEVSLDDEVEKELELLQLDTDDCEDVA